MKEENYKYTLTKDSKPGFELNTDHLSIVYRFLEPGICSMCLSESDCCLDDTVDLEAITIYKNILEYEKSKEFHLQDLKLLDALYYELIWEYLGTACGLEYDWNIIYV